jgi:hypothetical protein
MTSLARTFVCLGAGVVCGRVGLVVGAIFLPLAFPLSLTDSSHHAEHTVVRLMILTILLFAVAGSVLCWKLTGRWVRD